MRLLDRGDALIGMAAETGEDLADLLGVQERLRSLGTHELDERQPVRPGDHERVVGVAHDAGKFGPQDLVEDRVHVFGVDDRFHAGHRTQFTVKRSACRRPVSADLMGRVTSSLADIAPWRVDRSSSSTRNAATSLAATSSSRWSNSVVGGDRHAGDGEFAVGLQAGVHRVVGHAVRSARRAGRRRSRAGATWRSTVARRRRRPDDARRRRCAAASRTP